MKNNLEKKIEFIRNAVIMANNPECKTLEEALKKESKNKNCLYIFNPCELVKLTGGNVCNSNGDSIVSKIGTIEEAKSIVYKYITSQSLRKKTEIVLEKTLGLPISLERLLIALQNKECSCFNFLGNNLIEFKLEFQKGYFRFIPWQLNKTLELQSEKTIKELAEIFGYSKN